MRKTIVVEGMSCNHCKMRVTKALASIAGVTVAEVDLAGKKGTVESASEIPDEVLKNAVMDAGYVPGAITKG
ncbi:MAG: heavy-metal-associated domain-containing protein [Nitrospinae bacterium]|nr:heavy-metal-associated domain-containing protein [Nitrospinota bacterium]